VEPELLREPWRFALGQDQEASAGPLAVLERDREGAIAVSDGFDARAHERGAKSRHLRAGKALELRPSDLGNAEVIPEQRPVHGGLVLTVHRHGNTIFRQKQRGAEATRAVSNHDHRGRHTLS
jgi:hypothetical protein